MCEAVFWSGWRPREIISSYTSTAFSGAWTDAWLRRDKHNTGGAGSTKARCHGKSFLAGCRLSQNQ